MFSTERAPRIEPPPRVATSVNSGRTKEYRASRRYSSGNAPPGGPTLISNDIVAKCQDRARRHTLVCRTMSGLGRASIRKRQAQGSYFGVASLTCLRFFKPQARADRRRATIGRRYPPNPQTKLYARQLLPGLNFPTMRLIFKARVSLTLTPSIVSLSQTTSFGILVSLRATRGMEARTRTHSSLSGFFEPAGAYYIATSPR
jgi:hypothetical protein